MGSKRGSSGVSDWLEGLEAGRFYGPDEMPWGKTTLWRLRRDGLPAVRVGRGFIYRGGAILDWLRSREGK